MRRHRRHWQAAHANLTKMGLKDHVLIAMPWDDWEKPPEIKCMPRSEALKLPLPAYLLEPFKEPPVEDRFYCLATSGQVGTYMGMMASEGGYLPNVTIAPWGSDIGMIINPKTTQD
jgi:hypothetical protein